MLRGEVQVAIFGNNDTRSAECRASSRAYRPWRDIVNRVKSKTGHVVDESVFKACLGLERVWVPRGYFSQELDQRYPEREIYEVLEVKGSDVGLEKEPVMALPLRECMIRVCGRTCRACQILPIEGYSSISQIAVGHYPRWSECEFERQCLDSMCLQLDHGRNIPGAH